MKHETSKTTTPRLLGPSSDHRTQRWEVECPACGKLFVPMTTRLATQELDCPKAKCGAGMLARYNDEPPTVSLLPQ